MIAALLPQFVKAPATSSSWLEPLHDWPASVIRSLQTQDAVVRVVIAAVRGSSPRAAGTSMLVERERMFGTIGGGQLEWTAIAAARHMLASPAGRSVQVEKLILGPQLAQCCGGAVELWLERYTPADVELLNAAVEASSRSPTLLSTTVTGESIQRRIVRQLIRDDTQVELVRHDNGAMSLQERLDQAHPNIWLYGAGHVGQALARVLATLPLQLTWIDSRAELLPNDFSESVRTIAVSDPSATVSDAPRGTRFLVMTHSHPLDYALCKAVLERNDQAWLGVIGSKSKSARFRSRLGKDGLSREQVDRLICPIGVDGIDSKLPAVIAVSVATQLLQVFEVSARAVPVQAVEQHCDAAGCANCSRQGAAR